MARSQGQNLRHHHARRRPLAAEPAPTPSGLIFADSPAQSRRQAAHIGRRPAPLGHCRRRLRSTSRRRTSSPSPANCRSAPSSFTATTMPLRPGDSSRSGVQGRQAFRIATESDLARRPRLPRPVPPARRLIDARVEGQSGGYRTTRPLAPAPRRASKFWAPDPRRRPQPDNVAEASPGPALRRRKLLGVERRPRQKRSRSGAELRQRRTKC